MLIRLLVGRVRCYEFGSEFPGSKCIVFDSQQVDPTWNEKVDKMDLTSDPPYHLNLSWELPLLNSSIIEWI